MQVDSIARLMQLNQLQSMAGSGNSITGSNASSSFSSLLNEMINNASQTPSSVIIPTDGSAVNGVDGISSATKSTVGLDLQPEKMVQMLQMLSSQSMLSNASSIGDDSDSSDDSDDSDGSSDLAVTDNSANEMSQMVEQMLQTVMENQDSSGTASQGSSNAHSEIAGTKAL